MPLILKNCRDRGLVLVSDGFCTKDLLAITYSKVTTIGTFLNVSNRFEECNAAPQLLMSAEALLQWKQRIFDYQQSSNIQPQQGTLFEIAANPSDCNEINPLSLQLQNLACLELPDPGDRTCLYFVIDNTLPLLLYVGKQSLHLNNGGLITIAIATFCTTLNCTAAILLMWLLGLLFGMEQLAIAEKVAIALFV